MLCQNCKAAILIANDELWPTSDIGKASRQVKIHNDLTELQISAGSGCLICRKILESITGNQRPNTTHDFQLTVSLRPYGMRRVLVEGSYGDVHLEARYRMRKAWSDGKYDVTSQPNLHLSSTSETTDLWRKWFHECLESHSFCQSSTNKSPKFVPKRLVEIITDSNGNVEKWQLVLGDRIGEADYLTLSHCWGSSNHIRLTKQNLNDLITPSLCSVLPATYRDALVVAAALGIRYIWIDSLCIIQNDKDDWKSQSSVMGYIYKHSACNIAALRAADSSEGLFSPKEAPTILTLQGEEYQFEDDSTYRYAFEKEDIEDAPLNSRAWVVQERYLTPRQLGFGKSQIYWACRWTCASEESPDSNQSPHEQRVGQIWNLSPVDASRREKIEALLKDPGYMEKIDQAEHWSHLDYLENLEPRVTWPTLVAAYSKCHLTYLTDKSIALAGLAAELRETAKDTYIAGLWRYDLEYQLCWSVCATSRPHQTIRTIKPYVAPTWSWLNMDAPVVYDPVFRTKWRDTKCVEILEVSVQSEDPNALHSFTGSTLRLRGIVLRGCLTNCAEKDLGLAGSDRGSDVDPNGFKLKNLLSRPDRDPVEEVAVQIDWDEYQLSVAEDPQRYSRLQNERSSELLILPFRLRTISFANGLVLSPLEVTKDETICVRLGVFRFMKDGFPTFIQETLGLSEDSFGNDELDLKDTRISGLVQELCIQ